MSLDDKEKEAGVEQPEIVLSRDFTSTKNAYDDAKAFFTQTITSYYGKDAPGRTPDRKEISEGELNNLVGAFGEIFSNALFHGNLQLEGKVSDFLAKPATDPQWKPNMKVDVTIALHPSKLEVSVSDEGEGTFDVTKIVDQIRKIIALDIDTILQSNARAFLMLRDDQLGSPARVKVHYDEVGNKTGTTIKVTRDLNMSLPPPAALEPQDYIVVE